MHMTRVSSSRPRAARSVRSAERARSAGGTSTSLSRDDSREWLSQHGLVGGSSGPRCQLTCTSRTPRLDAGGGRNHWGSVFSVALAGGGVRGGQAYGASDRIGAYPKEGRVKPEDLAATLFHCLGHDPRGEYLDPLGRPHTVSRGEVLHAIL